MRLGYAIGVEKTIISALNIILLVLVAGPSPAQPPWPPDLQFTIQPTVDADEIYEGHSVTFSFEMRNGGLPPGTATGPFRIGVYRSLFPPLPCGYRCLWATFDYPAGLFTGETVSVEIPLQINSAGSYAFDIELDDLDDVQESDEGNNISAFVSVTVFDGTSWTPDGIAVCPVGADQANPRMISDGAGGTIITWEDQRNGNSDIYAQRINASGARMWNVGGEAICTEAADQFSPQLISDGAGGAIITWRDKRSGFFDIFAQRIDADGVTLWTTNGEAVTPNLLDDSTHSRPQLATDGAGGAIITWVNSHPLSTTSSASARRIDSGGTVLWGGAVIVGSSTVGGLYPVIISDEVGGAIIAYTKYTNGTSQLDIYAQRVSSAGTLVWPSAAPVCIYDFQQSTARITTDGAGGAIIAWWDGRSGTDVYAGRIDADGDPQWTVNGSRITNHGGNPSNHQIASAEVGEAFFTWQDDRYGDEDIWPCESGVGCSQPGDQSVPQIIADGLGGRIFTWQDDRNGNPDIYAQRRNDGENSWIVLGEPICTEASVQIAPQLTSDGAGGAIIAWTDSRGVNDNIYVQNVTAPVCEITPSSLDFGDVNVGSYADLTFTISNVSGASMRLDVFDPCQQYSVISGAGATVLAAGQSLPVTVRYEPTIAGLHECNIRTGIDYCGDVPVSGNAPAWTDITTSPLDITLSTVGGAWADVEGDGDLDLYLSNSGTNLFFRNDGVAGFVNATTVELAVGGLSRGAAWADSDNDGDLDLYLAQEDVSRPNRLLRNEGGGSFTELSSGPLGDTGDSHIVSWVDYDNDGLVDIFVTNATAANRLLHNEGDNVFTDATAPLLTGAGHVLGVAWGDFDDDGDSDAYLGVASGANKLIQNLGNGQFADATVAPLDDVGQARGAAWGDFDGDLDLDLYVGNWNGANKLFQNDGLGGFTDVTPALLADSGKAQGVAWIDFDLDGDLDLYLVNYEGSNRLFRNDSAGFVDATSASIAGPSAEAVWGDHDDDGDPDVYLAMPSGQSNLLVENNTTSGNHWIQVKLVGTESNRAGIGARLVLTAGGISQIREITGSSGFYSQHGLRATFGIGALSSAESLEIHWPSGIVNTYTEGVGIDRLLVVGESQGGATAIDSPSAIPSAYRLYSAIPNPFNPSTSIRFDLPKTGPVSLKIYDLAGRLVRTLKSDSMEAGTHEAVWRGRDDHGSQVASGVYLYSLEAGAYVETRRMVLLK